MTNKVQIRLLISRVHKLNLKGKVWVNGQFLLTDTGTGADAGSYQLFLKPSLEVRTIDTLKLTKGIKKLICIYSFKHA